MTVRAPLRIKFEECRQAMRIHGGLIPLCVAALGVRLARLPIPTRRLRLSLYRTVFGKKYRGLDESEAEQPLWAYRSLNAFFTRGLKPECRPIPTATPQYLCPCDGTVQEIGPIQHDKIWTLKGVAYTLKSLLPGVDTRPFEGGQFAIVFLSPVDCHRIFCPQDGQLVEAIHVPGFRLLVHPPYQRPEYPVYTLNERMILRFATALGPCLVVMVAGWGVGNITLPHDPSFRPRSRAAARRTWSPPVSVERGDWVATFELGSTAVVIAPPAADVVPLVSSNEKVKYGQPLFTYPGNGAAALL
jgi:phosphatidylserine decarboxylase